MIKTKKKQNNFYLLEHNKKFLSTVNFSLGDKDLEALIKGFKFEKI